MEIIGQSVSIIATYEYDRRTNDFGGMRMSREELKKVMEEIFAKDILSKFKEKNQSYGSEKNSNAFYNFEQTGNRLAANPKIDLNELDKKLLPLLAYMDKHNVALMQGLSST